MSERRDKLVGVLMGGWSQEREISLKSGQAVLRALENLGYQCVAIDVAPNIGEQLRQHPLDVVYIALHGRYGEDGVIQSLLEIQQIPYTSSSVLTSALAMDKYLSKELVRAQGLKTPDYCIFNRDLDNLEDFINNFSGTFPLMIKPSREGSSYG
ncbi:MAG: D-alanine--D-alanine ligase, partial [Deltaproteobacteria bacterium]|nr:D-alanine--D-alanine ligase [Deltaproteobacteria bacterium]